MTLILSNPFVQVSMNEVIEWLCFQSPYKLNHKLKLLATAKNN